MGDFFNLYTCLSIFLCLLTGGLFAWLLYGKSKHMEPKWRLVLALIRTLVVALIGFLVFAPLVKTVSYKVEKPIIVIGQDNSLSVGNFTPANFNKRLYEQQMQKLADLLAQDFEVRSYNFSDSVRTGFDFSNKGRLSNAASLLSRLNDEYLTRNVGAVILASDGIFNRGGDPLHELNKLKATVYTIALGDTVPKKDLLITNINHNSLAYLDNEFMIEVQVQAFEAGAAESLLSVSANGRQLYQTRLSINSNAFVKNVPIKLKATKPGLQKYTVKIGAVNQEVSQKNNVKSFFVDVIDSKQKVLIAAATPHPDITALKQAISLNKNHETKLVLAEELKSINPGEFNLVVLYQLPSTVYDGTAFLNKLGSVDAALWYIVGAQTDLIGLNKSQSLVSFSSGNKTLKETFSYVNSRFTQFDMNQETVRRIEAFDPLQTPLGKVALNGSNSTVLNQRVGKTNTDHPQLFFMQDKGRKMGFLLGEGVWRWKLSEAEASQEEPFAFNSLISKVVQYLSVKDDKRKFKVYTSRNTFDEGEKVVLNAVLYNDSYIPTNTPDVNIIIVNEAGARFNYLFSRTDAAYQLDAGVLPPGNYAYTATTFLGENKHLAKGNFYVDPVIAEYQQTVANHRLLNTMATQTSGKMYMPADLLKIADAIRANDEIKTLSHEDRRYEEMVNFKWLFALILLLLSTEWLFRKRNGEI